MTATNNTNFLFAKVADASRVENHLPSLGKLLQHCVNDEPDASSIGFLAPLSDHAARTYWLELLSSSITGLNPTTTMLIATLPNSSEVIATVQLARMHKETHTYKGEVRKLMVHPDYRRYGLGRKMMAEVERVAREELALELLVLDTSKETPAREFYLRTGWTEWGICPEYAKSASGVKHDCSFFVKKLA